MLTFYVELALKLRFTTCFQSLFAQRQEIEAEYHVLCQL